MTPDEQQAFLEGHRLVIVGIGRKGARAALVTGVLRA